MRFAEILNIWQGEMTLVSGNVEMFHELPCLLRKGDDGCIIIGVVVEGVISYEMIVRFHCEREQWSIHSVL